MFIIKSQGDYIKDAPRNNRKEGCLGTECKERAMRFDTREQAKAWLDQVRAKQRELGMRSYELAKGYAIEVKG